MNDKHKNPVNAIAGWFHGSGSGVGVWDEKQVEEQQVEGKVTDVIDPWPEA